ncbi:MAG: anhydro-N-acetylmuramic acid kinase [Lewinellaceae bacterium]|nr:anhydro-N-acetylmuramic acid kinase [Saprospiraceae bacterium]MCB9311990.1 anhydro-N-acetylmuramic acid kinase [Lewinellaceae bacterium]
MTDMIVTGLMSGSSLDGVDLATVRFAHQPDPSTPLHWALLASETIAFSQEWIHELKALPNGSALDIARGHVRLGDWFGRIIADFHQRHLVTPDLVASHGHTVFHYPREAVGFSTQIGDGARIAARIGLPVVCDLRSGDLAYGGQGAPMAPLADRLLFPDHDAWLNLGGIANITLHDRQAWIAWDLWACNQLLNALAGEVDLPMDQDGRLAAEGRWIAELGDAALAHPWMDAPPPKSLDNQVVQRELVQPFLDHSGRTVDKLFTAVDVLVRTIARALPARDGSSPGRLMVSGGGAHNGWLIKRLTHQLAGQHWVVERPSRVLIDQKEAILIALAGLYRWLGRPNLMASVTGASVDACSGAVYLPSNTYLRGV